MAQKNRKVSKFLAGGLLLLLVVGLSGLGARNFGGRVQSVGTVGDTEIDINDYSRALNQELRALQAQTGQSISLSQARQFGIDQAVLQRLIATAALENEARQIGLSVGDAEVQKQVVSNTAFQGINGSFDKDAYQYTLERNGMKPADYETRLRREAATNIIQSAVASGVAVPATYAKAMLDYIGQRRSFSWIELNGSTLSSALPEPSEDDLKAYFQANGDAFMLPPMKKITYVWLTPDMVMDQVQVDDAEVRALFDERADQYNVPEKRLVERLIFATAKEAQDAADAIAAGETSFEDLVKARGLTLQDVDMGDVARDDLGDAADAVFARADPGIAGPVDTELGPALFRINAILAPRSTAFEDVRDQLRKEIAADRARRLVADRTTELDDLLAGGATLEEVAGETDMQLGQIGWIDGQSSDGIAADDAFTQEARAVTTEDYPQISDLKNGGLFALRLDQDVPERPDSFENARPAVEAAWRKAELEKRLAEEADKVLARLGEGRTLSSLGFPVSVETRRTRTAAPQGVPPEFMKTVFSLEPGNAGAVKGDGKVFVVQVSEVLPPDTEDADIIRVRQAIEDDMKQGLGQDALAAFTRASELQAGISLNQAAINAVHAQFP